MVSFACLRFSQPPSVLRDFEYTDLNSGLGYTVTKDDYELRKAANVFGWSWEVEGRQAYVGWPRIKRSLFFAIFFRITKS
jgi:hypothetical protein